LVALQKAKKKLLEAKEVEWNLKSKALWMKNGYGNTKLFQAYAKGRKMSNTIWILRMKIEGNIPILRNWPIWAQATSKTYSNLMHESPLMQSCN